IHRANERELVEHGCLPRQVLTDQDSRVTGSDGLEWAPVDVGSVGLWVPRVDMAWTPRHPEQYDALAVFCRPPNLRCLGLPAQQVSDCQATNAGQARLEEIAPARDHETFAVARVEVLEGMLVGMSDTTNSRHGGSFGMRAGRYRVVYQACVRRETPRDVSEK